MIRRPPRSTLSSSSAASDVYKRQAADTLAGWRRDGVLCPDEQPALYVYGESGVDEDSGTAHTQRGLLGCLLYTSDAADEEDSVDLGGRRIIKKKMKGVQDK